MTPSLISYFRQFLYKDAHLYSPFVCQISRQSDMAFAFYASFVSVRKEEEKTKKLSQFLKWEVEYLGNTSIDFAQIWYVEYRSWRACLHKIVLFQKGSTKLRCFEIRVSFLPVNILTGVACWLPWPHDTVCLH